VNPPGADKVECVAVVDRDDDARFARRARNGTLPFRSIIDPATG